MAVNDDLARFNAFVANEAEQEKQGRRVKRAEQAKEKAAGEVRRLDADSSATAEQKAEAKQAYLDAQEAWRREVSGEGADDPTPADADSADAAEVADGEAPEAETSGESEPADAETTGESEPVVEAEPVEEPVEEQTVEAASEAEPSAD